MATHKTYHIQMGYRKPGRCYSVLAITVAVERLARQAYVERHIQKQAVSVSI